MSPPDPITLAVDPCRELAERLFRDCGLSADQARLVADPLIEAELRGRATHGLIRVPGLVKQIRQGNARPVRIDRDGGSWLAVDGGDGIGYLIAQQALGWAVERAREHGTSLVAVRRATHCGMLGYYVDRIARQGLVGLMTCNCYPRIVPHHGTRPVLGTNPIAIAAPTHTEPILLDMSTASITIGELMVAARRGDKVDPGLAFDAHGQPTTDPNAALAGGVAAFGRHKGYGLALMTQILTSALVGSAILPGRGDDYGYLIAAIDPAIFTDKDTFTREVTQLAHHIRTIPPAPGHDGVRLPGDRTWQERARRLKHGIPVDRDLYDELLALT
jgi:L-2-hydroxycarboxylate dehydrogenase (NAD+)